VAAIWPSALSFGAQSEGVAPSFQQGIWQNSRDSMDVTACLDLWVYAFLTTRVRLADKWCLHRMAGALPKLLDDLHLVARHFTDFAGMENLRSHLLLGCTSKPNHVCMWFCLENKRKNLVGCQTAPVCYTDNSMQKPPNYQRCNCRLCNVHKRELYSHESSWKGKREKRPSSFVF
jgi:hypothetical protein